MEKNDSTEELLGGFKAIFDNDFTPNKDVEEDETVTLAAAEDIDEDEIPVNKNKKVDVTEEESEEDDNDDDEEETTVVETKSKVRSEKKVDVTPETEDDDDTNENESNVVSGLFDAIADQLGWELDDETEKPTDAESIVKYFQKVIEEESVPTYANDEVKALDEFVRNGGKLQDFYKVESDFNIETADLEDEDTQKRIVSDYLREKGLNDKQIERKVTKYEDAGILEDEAEDALEALREIKEQKKEELLETQKKTATEANNRQQAFYSNVVNEIQGMKDVRGIKIPENDKKSLLEYIFKPDATGMTKYQKDYAKNVKNLIESAYFTMKGDVLLSAAKSEGTKDAIKNFKNSLRTAPVTKTRKITSDTGKSSIWDTVAQQLTTKK